MESWGWGKPAWQNADLDRFPELVQNGSAEFILWAPSCVVGSDGERLREGRAPASGGDASACQEIRTAVLVILCNAIYQDQIMETTFLSKILPNYSLKNAKL